MNYKVNDLNTTQAKLLSNIVLEMNKQKVKHTLAFIVNSTNTYLIISQIKHYSFAYTLLL